MRIDGGMKYRKIREIDQDYHCSIIGTCLSIKEVQAILEESQKHDYSEYTPHYMHAVAVKSAGQVCRVSNRITEKLNIKYRIDMHRASVYDNHIDLERYWDTALADGNIPGPYWTVLSHESCTEELMVKAFGEVHMLAHTATSEECRRRAEIEKLRSGNKSLRVKIDELKTDLSEAFEKSKHLQRENIFLKSEIAVLKKNDKSKRFETEEKSRNLPLLNAEISRLKRKLGNSRSREEKLNSSLKRLKFELNEVREYAESMKADNGIYLNKIVSCFSEPSESAHDSDSDLMGKRVLLVGGRQSLVPHCKSVVEAMNGQFVYHDGGKEQSRNALPEMASGADIIICALDCVSHDASRCVKRICRSNSRKMVMLKNSGLSSFARELLKAV